MAMRFRTLPLIAALAVLLFAPAAASAQERTVSVSGTATRKVPNDTAGLGLSVSLERRSRTAALRAVATRLRAVIAVAEGTPGVGAGDVTTGRISVRKVVRHEHTAFRAGEGISVILHQPDQAGQLVSAAIAAGATGTSGPRFFPGDPELAYDNTLVAAFDQAKAKATALAIQAGAVLGPAISIEEAAEIAPKLPAKGRAKGVAAAPSPPVKPGASTVTASVHVVFALQ